MQAFVKRHGLFTRGKSLVVGVSGGPDSVCLLHVLVSLRERLDIDLHVAHLNHGLRGKEAEGDALYVQSLAQSLGIPATVGQRDAKAYRKAHPRLSLEEAARELRYTFLAEVAEKVGAHATGVAVGHTASDQVETILMHLIRGAGLAGLQGMPPSIILRLPSGAALRLVRPLLEVWREETEAYCTVHSLSPRTDMTNLSLSHLRNRIRLELIPLLKKYNPRFEEALLRLAQAAYQDISHIEAEAAKVWDPVVKKEKGGLTLDTKNISRLPTSLKHHLLRMVLREFLGDLMDIEAVHIEEMAAFLEKPAGRVLSLPRGLMLFQGYDTCIVARKDTDLCPLPELDGETRLSIPGETLLPGWRVKATVSSKEGGGTEAWKAKLDLDSVGKELTVRPRRQGDRFHPLGMDVPKKLQDFMVDEKIPRSWRDRVPIVCSPKHIVWVAGWRMDERARVTSHTRNILFLEFEPLTPEG